MSDSAGQASLFPDSYQAITWEKFDGLNTKPPRPAIAESEMFWSDGWMPIGPSNLRVLWGAGDPIYSTTSPVQWFGFGNIGDTAYGVVLRADGAVYQFDTATG